MFFATFTPETAAASVLPPIANMFLPNVVLFHMTHITIAQIKKNQTRFGIPKICRPFTRSIYLGSRLAKGCAPPSWLSIYRHRMPYAMSCVPSEMMKACICSFATPKPFTKQNATQTTMERISGTQSGRGSVMPLYIRDA